MSTTTTIARNAFLSAVGERIHTITNNNLGKPAWVAGVELMALAIEFADFEVSSDIVRSQLKLAKSHFAVDGHNWNNYAKAYNENFRDFCLFLLAKKESGEY
jgi:hypothetical protein